MTQKTKNKYREGNKKDDNKDNGKGCRFGRKWNNKDKCKKT